MDRTITQRELRNDSGRVLREVQAGTTLIVIRNGTPVAELRPVQPRRFVPRAVIVDAAVVLLASMHPHSGETWMRSATSPSMA